MDLKLTFDESDADVFERMLQERYELYNFTFEKIPVYIKSKNKTDYDFIISSEDPMAFYAIGYNGRAALIKNNMQQVNSKTNE